MTDDVQPAPASPRTGPGTALPRRAARVRVRRNVRWLAAGVVAVTLGGLGTWALFSMAAGTRSAIKVTSTIYRGEAIEAKDLAVVAIGRTTDVPAVSGDELNAVVGQRARTDLPAGGLIVEQSVGSPDLERGLARVGVKLEPGRLPSTPLRPGERVLVVAVPTAVSEAAGLASTGLPASVEATLALAPAAAADGSYVVDLNVPQARAEQVARLAALKQVVIVQRAAS
jgi:hypothetical protein